MTRLPTIYHLRNPTLLVALVITQYLLTQEEFYGRELILADRDMVEQEADEILKGADTVDVAFLVVGDPFG